MQSVVTSLLNHLAIVLRIPLFWLRTNFLVLVWKVCNNHRRSVSKTEEIVELTPVELKTRVVDSSKSKSGSNNEYFLQLQKDQGVDINIVCTDSEDSSSIRDVEECSLLEEGSFTHSCLVQPLLEESISPSLLSEETGLNTCESFKDIGFNKEVTTMTVDISANMTKPDSGADLPALRINSVTLEEHPPSHICDLEDLHEDILLEHDENERRDSLFVDSDGDHEAYHPDDDDHIRERRDSGHSGSSSDGQDAENKEPTSPETRQRIIDQVEFMFSDDHLAKDGFLLKHCRRRSDGFVSLKLVAGLRKVKQISREFPTILNAVQQSEKLEVNTEGTKIRRKDPLSSYLKSLPTTSKEKKERENHSSCDDPLDSKTTAKSNINNNNTNNRDISALSETQRHKNSHNNKNHSANNKKGQYYNQNKSAQQQQQHYQSGQSMRKMSNAGGNNGGCCNCNCRNNSFNCQDGPRSRGNSFSKTMPGEGGPRSRGNSFSKYSSMEGRMRVNSMGKAGDRRMSVPVDDDMAQLRKRGGSLPIPMGNPHLMNRAHLSPNVSPPEEEFVMRPKSNSYCEGSSSPNGTSSWLQRRRASSRISEGTLSLSGVIRQPRGPDGTKGFAKGYRDIIMKERLQTIQSTSTLCA